MLLVTFATLVIGHIFNYSNRWHFQSVKHFNSFYNVNEGKFLWGGHDNSCSDLHLLTERKLDVTSTRREVHH
jgi:hypothetical protein